MEIARVYLDIPMYYSFDGLKEIMRKSKTNPDTIPNGKFTLFINKSQTSFKMLVGQNHLVYHRNGTRKFPLEAIAHIPHFFEGGKLNFAAAVRRTIESKMAGKLG